MKVLSIVGARPQFVKAAMLSREIRKLDTEILVHTGQHYDFEMSQIFFDSMEIPKPDYNLGVGSGTHCEQLSKVMLGLEKALGETDPDIVLTYGDTNSTLGGALTAVKAGYPTAHVEAGLRSFNRSMPEEINRVVTDHVSDILFCPTATAVNNLANEGITKNVFLVGDVMVDALMLNSKIAIQKSNILSELGLREGEYLAMTVHRASNADDMQNLKSIMEAVAESGMKVVFPIHPRTEKRLEEFGMLGWLKKAANLILTKPLGYTDFMRLMMGAKKVVTDSGGIQKEAYILKIPCITVREDTEWVETVDDGWNILVGSDKQKILDAIANFEPKGLQKAEFGEGKAAIKIARMLHEGLEEMLTNKPGAGPDDMIR